MRGLSDIVKAALLIVVAVMMLTIAVIAPSWYHNPKTALFQPAEPVYPANASYVIAEPYKLNETYFTNLTIYLSIMDKKLPSVFVTKVAIANISNTKNLTYVPIKITYIADEYSNSKGEVVSSTNPEDVLIRIGCNLLTIEGFVVGNLNFSTRITSILISFSNNETCVIPAFLNVTNASMT